jgi:subtilisin-like proprotein convertase family protein
MNNFRSCQARRLVLATLILATLAIGLYLFQGEGVSIFNPNDPAARRESLSPTSSPSEALLGLAALTDDANELKLNWTLSDGGREKEFKLALDEVVIRDSEGMDHRRELVPAATHGTYAARIDELASEGTVLPVVFPADEEKTPSNVRFVTSSLLVEAAEGVDREALPGALDLPVNSRPQASPHHIVLAASSPLAALAGLDVWRTMAKVASVDVLLARQQFKRAMPNDTFINNQWHLKFNNQSGALNGTDVNIESVWNYPALSTDPNTWRGGGIRIGIVDDGLQTAHPDLVSNVDVANDKDWNGNDLDPNPGTGDDHGTACAGNAAARGNNGLGVSGTAPEAMLVGMRLIAAAATDAQEAEAMDHLNNIIQVKSNSWGPADDATTVEGPGTLTRAAFANATANGRGGLGTIILWAGGNGGDVNDNSNYDGYANSIYTMAIGAYDSQNRRAYYSEPGANLIAVAPSSGDTPSLGITTVDRSGSVGYNTGSTSGEISDANYTQTFGGTSSATPTMAGIVADLLQSKPTLGWRDVQEILIRSAKKVNPTNSGWANNGAGFHFHHDYGAGLVDAAAAIALASTWSNLPATAAPVVSSQTGLSVAIPNNNATGITRSFDLSSSNLRIEQVTVNVGINHNSSGDLAITLTSPSGMVSKLSEGHTDPNNHFNGWTFMSTRHWGENSAGTWTLKIVDNTNGNAITGSLSAVTLTLYGTSATPVNPPPLVQITSPADGAFFSPGATVNVSVNASDTVIGGGPGAVTQVQLLDNGSVVATDTTSPYSFSLTPALGAHALVARAIDSEGAITNSAVVNITLANSPPVITAGGIGTSPGFDDTALTVTGVLASDPDGTVPTISYQWQSSTDGVSFTDVSGLSSNSLPANPTRSGLVWRCKLIPSDGLASGAEFFTNGVNLVDRPTTTANAGSSYSYQSGLVLRSGGGGVTRDAIIHEFSQGPSGSSEWIEILVLRNANLRYWDLEDNAGNLLLFQDTAVWENIPAGTRIVIYNGTVGVPKDPILPADDTDPSDRRMVLSSTNATYFDPTFDPWLPLANGGDGIYLVDEAGNAVSEVGYGNDTLAAINVGAVGSGKAAYYSGDSDEGSNVAGNWTSTTSLSARSFKVTRAAGDLFISEYVEGSGNNKALEIYNPSSSAVDLTAAGYKVEIYYNGSSVAGATLNMTGTLAAGGTFVLKNNASTGVISAVSAQISNLNVNFSGDDAVLLKKGSVTVDCFGQVGNDPGTAWTALGGYSTADKTLRRKSSILQGDTDSSNAFDPSIEWDVFAIDTISGLGSHTVGSPAPSLAVSINPTSFAETAGASAATGTVTVSQAPTTNLTVTLASLDPTELTVPATVTILANQTTATFAVAAVDDALSDGTQSVVINSSASGYTQGSATVSVTDNEVSLVGVTPGAANTPANATWIASLVAGTAGSPALFRLGTGSTLPAGLTLDANTGLISGTIGTSASGSYSIIIERYNSSGEVVSQSFTLNISAATGYLGWVGGYNTLSDSAATADPDKDGFANVIEYYLGLNPGIHDSAGVIITGKTPTSLSLTYRRPKGTTGLTPVVECSASLAAGSWSSNGISEQLLEDNPGDQLVKATLVISEADPRKFIRLRVTLSP